MNIKYIAIASLIVLSGCSKPPSAPGEFPVDEMVEVSTEPLFNVGNHSPCEVIAFDRFSQIGTIHKVDIAIEDGTLCKAMVTYEGYEGIVKMPFDALYTEYSDTISYEAFERYPQQATSSPFPTLPAEHISRYALNVFHNKPECVTYINEIVTEQRPIYDNFNASAGVNKLPNCITRSNMIFNSLKVHLESRQTPNDNPQVGCQRVHDVLATEDMYKRDDEHSFFISEDGKCQLVGVSYAGFDEDTEQYRVRLSSYTYSYKNYPANGFLLIPVEDHIGFEADVSLNTNFTTNGIKDEILANPNVLAAIKNAHANILASPRLATDRQYYLDNKEHIESMKAIGRGITYGNY